MRQLHPCSRRQCFQAAYVHVKCPVAAAVRVTRMVAPLYAFAVSRVTVRLPVIGEL